MSQCFDMYGLYVNLCMWVTRKYGYDFWYRGVKTQIQCMLVMVGDEEWQGTGRAHLHKITEDAHHSKQGHISVLLSINIINHLWKH